MCAFKLIRVIKLTKKIKFYALKKYDITIEKRKQSAIITLVYKEKW